ncbi:uncharacterized protein DUF4998 [Chitinophaga dinghuensis]|uniref:Uncharacterized protein DUF4998 n=1 Tax=Chitinophaga dinghuensis TaxID=1539050 RepID=A0A327VRM6_9BACT|nr:DUF4998 domain-containing protein [Chitinophaga dinghuensis]RAJ76710.1 uncharacterized protein DUF4998 [Chitinophaga dinghuensis]
MKKILLGAAAVMLLFACTKMDDNYKGMLAPNGITYTGKADSLKVWPGRERIRLSWLRGTDPSIKDAVIYWNTGRDSLVVTVPAGRSTDSVFAMLPSLPENSYSFSVYTRDGSGHRSIKSDILGSSYGAIYESSLQPRVIKSSKMIGTDFCIYWYRSNDANNFNTRLRYTDNTGTVRSIDSPGDPDSVLLPNATKTSYATFRTMYRPGAFAIDTFYSRRDSLKIQ